jgi:Protein of unknown function (DUF1822)
MTSNSQQPILIPLPEAAHRWARIFASKQLDVPSGRKVYLNTLSVFIVDDYLQELGISTDLEGSDSWYPGLTTRTDAADLELIDIGKIECRPLFAEDTKLQLPESIPSNVIGYIAIQLNDALDTASLIGYSPILSDINNKSIDLKDLQPIADLPNYLGKIRDGYSILDSETDNPVITELLAEIESSLLSSFVAQCRRIYEDGNITPRGKKLQIQTLLDPSLLAGSQKSKAERETDYNKQEKIRNLAASWLEILDRIWAD